MWPPNAEARREGVAGDMEHTGIQQQLLTMLQEIAAVVRVLTNNPSSSWPDLHCSSHPSLASPRRALVSASLAATIEFSPASVAKTTNRPFSSLLLGIHLSQNLNSGIQRGSNGQIR